MASNCSIRTRMTLMPDPRRTRGGGSNRAPEKRASGLPRANAGPPPGDPRSAPGRQIAR
jgi:hypothetical protein